jgi:electron transfer flavoprotein beta subunit
MHIALCVKQVPDMTGPFSLTEEADSLAGLVPIANPADLAALALVRQTLPRGNATVTAVTVGGKATECVLRQCLSLGADEVLRVWDDAFTESTLDGDTIARVLAAAISSLGIDLVVCGSRGLRGGSGYVGPAVAEYLDLAQVCSVSRLELLAGEHDLIVQRRLDRGDREIVACKLPALITVDDGAAETPYASFPDVLAAEQAQIPVVDLAALGIKAPAVLAGGRGKLLRYVPPRPRTKRVLAPDKSLSPLQQMQMAMGGGAAKKDSGIVEGTPKKVAAEIVRFLESNGFLSS